MTRVWPRRLLPIAAALALSVAASAVSAPASEIECASFAGAATSNHIGLWLSGLPDQSTPFHAFYYAAEDAGSGRFEVLGGAHVCNETASVRFATREDSALANQDFEPASGIADFTIVHVADPVAVEVPIHQDGQAEAPLESFRVQLSRPRNGNLRAPSEAPFYVIDDDGADRVTLDHEPYVVREFEGVVRVVLFRAGPAGGSLSVPFAVEPSGSSPATPGEDYTVSTAGPVTFGAGERVTVIEIAIADDGVPEADETIRVSLTQGPAASVNETTVTIDGEVDASPPRSRFHHPRDGWRYARDDYRIREIHVFTGDGEGSGVVRMSFALRRNASNGTCAWWDGNGFRRGDCEQPRWLRMRAYERGSFYYFRLDPLGSSVGTTIESYTAFAQGEDSAGNLEVDLAEGRNRNTFEVEPR